MESENSLASPPSPPSTLSATGPPTNGGGLSSRSPSSSNLKNLRSSDEAARISIINFANQQASLLAAMFAQRFIHVANQTGVDIETLHSHFMGEFIPAFVESLHSSMAGAPIGDPCEMCGELGQRAAFLATCQSTGPPQVNGVNSFQQRSNSVSFGSRGKNSPPLSFLDNSPCTPSSLGASLNTASIYSLNKAAAHNDKPNNGHGNSTVGSKIKNLFGQFRRRTISSTNQRDATTLPLPSDSTGLSSTSLSLPVDVVIEGVLEMHTRAPGSNHNTVSSRSTLSNSRDLLTSIPQHSELEKEEDDEHSSGKDDNLDSVSVSKSTEFLADSPWLPVHVRLLRSSAGPLLVLQYPPDANQPPCGISMSSINEVRAATIGDALTSDDHAFILVSSSLSCRVLLKAASRADMNRWLDALRPCVAFHPPAMVPLFPVNKFGLSVPQQNHNNNNMARFGGTLFGNISGTPMHHHSNEPSTPKSTHSDLPRSTSFQARRRIQTSPAVDLQHLFSKNSKNNKQIVTPGSADDTASTAALEVGGTSRHTSTDTPSNVSTPPRPLSPIISGTAAGSASQQQQRPLNTFPWYWGNISRHEAAEVVCKFGESGTGCFVIRQSESQHGDHVITFNCNGDAKHLRLKVFTDGRCQLNTFAFPSVQALVDHFRTNPLPIDFGSDESCVMLINYVSRRPMTPSAVKG